MYIDQLTLVNAAQIAEDDIVYVGRPGDVDPDRRTEIMSLREKMLMDPGGDPFYSEGSWTPTLTATTTPPSAITYTTQLGHWWRIGQLVTIGLHLQTSAITGGSGNVRIAGLPYNVAHPGAASVFSAAVELNNVTYTAGATVVAIAVHNTTEVTLQMVISAANVSSMPIANWTTGGNRRARFSLTYRTNQAP